MKSLFLLAILLFSVGITAQSDSLAAPRIAIKIPLGETVAIDEIIVEFVEILEDSRCPTTVECIWAGRVRVKVLVTTKGENTMEKELIFGTIRPGESRDKTLCEQTNFNIQGVQVMPYPEKPGQKMEYLLLVEKVLLN